MRNEHDTPIAQKQKALLIAHLAFIDDVRKAGVGHEEAAVLVGTYLRHFPEITARNVDAITSELRGALVAAGNSRDRAGAIISTNGRIYDAILNRDKYSKRALKNDIRRKGYHAT